MEPWELIIKALGSAVGPIIGAIVAIAGIWAKDVLEARKNALNWFEQTYITEGTDPLLAYLRLQDLLLTMLLGTTQTIELPGVGRFPNIDNLSKDVPISVFPVEALVRIETLLKTKEYTALIATLPEFTRLYSNIEPEKRIAPVLRDKINLVRDAYNSLATVRQELLEAKVNKKKKLRKLHENQSIKNTLAQFAEQSQKWNARILDRDKLISEGG